MATRKFFQGFTIASYGRNVEYAPREVIFNKKLIFSATLYASAAIPQTWDQGSASVITSLPAFQHQFGISSAGNAGEVRNFLSLVYLGDAIGAGLSFFLNDRVGRLWSFRIYLTLWAIGQLIAILAPNSAALYASRIICGCGIVALTVTAPISIVEIAPAEIRGLLTSWYAVMMGLAHFVSAFGVLGVYKNMAESKLQYQVIWLPPVIFAALAIGASFFLCESPRWLFMAGRREQAMETLTTLRGLPESHQRVFQEIRDIETDISTEAELDMSPKTWTGDDFVRLTTPLGRQLDWVLFRPNPRDHGIAGDRERNMFLTGMYTMTKFFYALIVSFFFIDVLGRRMSLFVGTMTQIITNIYISAYIKVQQDNDGHVATGAPQAALAATFIDAFGFSVGLLILPYVFGGELFPNRIRSFGASFPQCFHWLFRYAVGFAVPSILSSMHQWGAFVFFGACVEEMNSLFEGPWYNAYKLTCKSVAKRTDQYAVDNASSKNSADKNRVASDEIEDSSKHRLV